MSNSKKEEKNSSTENEEEVNNSRQICIIQWLIFFSVWLRMFIDAKINTK